MKSIEYSSQMNNLQIIELAKDLLKKIFDEVPSVSSVEVIEHKIETQAFDIMLQIDFHTQPSVKIAAEVKNNGEIKYVRAAINNLNSLLQKGEYGVVVAPYISLDAAHLCEQNGIGYLDFSGNCLIKYSSIYIRTEGKPNKNIIKKESKNLLLRSAIKSGIVLREMLNEPDKHWKVQELANATQISIGMISNIKRYLLAKEWCVEEDGEFALCNIKGLLKEWSVDYNKTKNISYEFYSFNSVPEIEKQMFEFYNKIGVKCFLASFSAAVRYKPTVTYNKAYAYVAQRDFEAAVSFLNLKPVDSGGNVELILYYDDCVLMHSRKIKDALITSPAQTVLDLYANKARGEEAANEIIDKEFNTNA